MTIRWDWIGRNLDVITGNMMAHVYLVVIAVVVGFLISAVLASFILRRPRAYAQVTAVTGIMYTIPSLALFALLIPVTGTSVLTVEIGLVSYTLLILVRHIVAGMRGVDRSVVEAATGMGYTGRRLRWEIEVPLALPVILVGLRVATVTTVGLATMAAIIGVEGLGSLIYRGLQDFTFPTGQTQMLVGTTLAVILAIVLDLLLVGAARILTPWARRRGA